MTCSPNQSKFTTAVRVGQGYDPKLNIRPINGTQSNYVSALGYNVNNQYADSMFNSCVHVTNPSNVPSVKVLCGPYGHECTAQKWITFMNDIQNGQAAYDVQVTFSYTAMVGMNYKTQSCQEKSYAGEPACACSDCPPSCLAPSTPHSMEKYFKKTFGPHYRLEQLNITAPHSSRSIYEQFTTSTDPADQKQIPFGPILQKSILHKILTLQRSINQLTAQYNGKTITLQDICFKAPDNKTCIVLSPLNYFQNNHTNLNKEAFIAGFFLAADYHDHLMSCVQHPNTNDDRTYLRMSCLGTFNGPIIPWVVLGGYDAYNYLNATVATVTFPVMGYPDDVQSLNETLAWEKEFFSFMENYTSHAGDLSVKYAAGFQFELREN
ncbi:NPC intracellular cholesterol transporter 1-like [Clavelina lepadiformis]|uniref:NPC intracellular cholesterol transporter 1-like n=1 Tax=Clavelina lepadiformis TaxID=159417 RepID=UPI0040419F8C